MNHPLQEHMMSNLIGHDIGDFCDLIVRRANAALPRVTGLVGKPEPKVSALTGDHPISQSSTKESE